MTAPPRDQLLTTEQVAVRLNRSVRTVKRLRDDSVAFRCCRVRGTTMIWESSVEDFLQRETDRWHQENGDVEKFVGKSGQTGTSRLDKYPQAKENQAHKRGKP